MQVWFINPQEEIIQASPPVQEQPSTSIILGIKSWEVHTFPVLGTQLYICIAYYYYCHDDHAYYCIVYEMMICSTNRQALILWNI